MKIDRINALKTDRCKKWKIWQSEIHAQVRNQDLWFWKLTLRFWNCARICKIRNEKLFDKKFKTQNKEWKYASLKIKNAQFEN